MILVTGEILFDIFPDCRRMGGAPFNFAFHLKKLGFPVRFFSRVGDDGEGAEILDFLDRSGFDTDDIQIDPDYGTGRVTIDIDEKGNHRFYIQKNVAYDHIEFGPKLEAIIDEIPDLIYFGSLVQRTSVGLSTIQRILSEKKKKTKTLCDINLRDGCWTRDSVGASINRADILKLNLDELVHLINLSLTDLNLPRTYIPSSADSNSKNASKIFHVAQPSRSVSPDISNLTAQKLLDIDDCVFRELVYLSLFVHGVESVILTKGADGSEWITRERRISSKPVNNLLIEDPVGAGDAYAAVAAACYLKGYPEERIISLAGKFASRVCTIRGAIPENDEIYDWFRAVEENENG